MVKINILTEGFVSPNVRSVLFPLLVHRTHLKERGIHWRAFRHMSPKIFECDVLIIESNYHGKRWLNESAAILDGLADVQTRVKRLFYLDTSDSTALLHPEILPYVDRYYKLQLLRNRDEYKVAHYGNRAFTNFSHEKYGIEDAAPSYSTPVMEDLLLEKLYVWHSSSLADYSRAGRYRAALYSRFPLSMFLRYPQNIVSPRTNRPLDVSCRMGVSYDRETVAWYRRQARVHLSRWIPTDRVSYAQYVRELENSKIVVSPFGWGEVNYKDFETFLAGALLIKPDMSHLETWPDLYRPNDTYLAYDWGCENLVEVIENALANWGYHQDISESGQKQYLSYINGNAAAGIFCDRLKHLIAEETPPSSPSHSET